MLITFVCTGNTCRSPMAEYILKDKIKKAKLKGIRVKSAGTYAENDLPMSDNSLLALKINGIKATNFKSKRLTFTMLGKSDMIVCMTENHKRELEEFTNKAVTCKEISGMDVIDPYGYDIGIYLKTFEIINEVCEKILEKLKEKLK